MSLVIAVTRFFICLNLTFRIKCIIIVFKCLMVVTDHKFNRVLCTALRIPARLFLCPNVKIKLFFIFCFTKFVH